MFARIVFSAALSGLLVGLLWTALQQVWTVPLILEAETYEVAASGAGEHDHGEEAWAPADGAERLIFTALGNIVLAIGLGMLLGAFYSLRGGVNWRQGLQWGLAGFATLHLAPALGLPPELPGTEAAPLLARQIWWIATVLLTGAGLALLIFPRGIVWKCVAVGLLALPHLLGAPHPEVAGGLAPPELEREFVIATLATNAVAWLALGALTALIFDRLGGRFDGTVRTAASA